MIIKQQVFGSSYFYFSRGKNCFASPIDLSQFARAEIQLMTGKTGGNIRGKSDVTTRHFTACCSVFQVDTFAVCEKLRKRNKLLTVLKGVSKFRSYIARPFQFTVSIRLVPGRCLCINEVGSAGRRGGRRPGVRELSHVFILRFLCCRQQAFCGILVDIMF